MNGLDLQNKTMQDIINETNEQINTMMNDAYKRGEWDMFVCLTAAEYGKECYFPQDNGTVYSRVSGQELPDAEAAYTEWIKYIY